MPTRDFKRVYVWELPVRLFHWLNALAITVLAVTGYIIARPPAILSSTEATDLYWFGILRATHFIAAYVFLFALILRVYWLFVGNQFGSWSAYNVFNKRAMGSLVHVIKTDILLINEKDPIICRFSIGHNVVAASAYIVFFILFLIMIFTGFGLYADMSEWWLPNLFAWVPAAMGGDMEARFLHHITMWFIVFIVIIHVYLVLYHGWLEGRGEVSSMISGYKFVCKDRVKQQMDLLDRIKDPDEIGD
jgi:Ni/Fe-hydrogenase 1 B-type cytochrome subunit